MAKLRKLNSLTFFQQLERSLNFTMASFLNFNFSNKFDYTFCNNQHLFYQNNALLGRFQLHCLDLM